MSDVRYPPPPPRTEPDPGWKLCWECRGARICIACDGQGELAPGERCFMCGGSRWCYVCGGSGQVPEDAVRRHHSSDLP